jgi:hypothetical protein
MEPFTGKDIYVREGVARILADTNARLQLVSLNLIVGYGRFYAIFAEYWHFMYGDHEWAYFSGLDTSLYGRIEFKASSL